MTNTWKLAAAAFAVTLALGACSSGSSDEDAASESTATSSETRTVTSSFTGEDVEIPTDPQRVVTLWRVGSEVADLGVVPVATIEGEFLDTELSPEVYQNYADIPTVGTFEGVDVEKVIEADPDLIIGMDNGGLGIDYDQLSQVAPVVIMDIAEPTDVWSNYPEVADLLGRTTDFTDQEKALDERLAGIKSEYGDQVADLKATSINTSANGEVGIYTSKSLNYERITAAGFGYNDAYVDNPERYITSISMENIPDLADQDVIFYQVDLAGETAPEVQAIIDSAAFQALPAAAAGNVFPLTSGTIYTFEAANQQADDIEAAAEGYTA